MARPQSHRPATSVPERELSPAGRLELSIWRTSAQALADFRTRSYSPSETERALGDAVGDNRFGPAAVYSQRLNMKLYFAITRLMRRRGLHELPWPQRELDNLLDEFESEPSIREINIDFLVVAHKLIRNGAFDHLIGLTTTIVSIQYLPGVKKLMDRRLLEQVPAVRYNDSARVLPPQTGVRSPRTSLHRPIPSPINTTRFPPNVIPTEAIKSATTEIKSPLVKTPLIAISNPENIGAG